MTSMPSWVTPRAEPAARILPDLLRCPEPDPTCPCHDESPAAVQNVLAEPGRPLDPTTRGQMESHFGYGFGQVRVHTDDRAAATAHDQSASAYTVGSHIVFGAGRYAPETADGQRLLAHELAHVVQQGGEHPHAALRHAADGPGTSTL
jgi:hypothetical protein